MAKDSIPEINIPLDEFVMQIATKAALLALAEHRQACSINALQEEIWGNGKPGMKTDIISVQTEQKEIRQSMQRIEQKVCGPRTYIRELSKPILAALIVALLMWMFAGQRGPAPTAAQTPAAKAPGP